MARVKDISPDTKYSIEDNYYTPVNKQINNAGMLKRLIVKYNAQCSVNILESQGFHFSYLEHADGIDHLDNNFKRIRELLYDVFKRSDFDNQFQRYGKILAEEGAVYFSLVKIGGLWYIQINAASEVEAKRFFRKYKEVHVRVDEQDDEGNDIYIEQKIKTIDGKEVLVQTKVIKKDDVYEAVPKTQIILKNISFIPTGIIRNNCDSQGDVANVEWLIQKLDNYWEMMDPEFNHAKLLLLYDKSVTGGPTGEQVARMREWGGSRVIESASYSGFSTEYQAPPQEPYQTLMWTIEWLEDKIMKFIPSFREKNLKDKQQKNDLEIASLDQIAIEYYLHKKQQREKDLTYFFNEIVLDIFNLENGTKVQTIGDCIIPVSEFQEAKLQSIKQSEIKNENLQAQAGNYQASANKMRDESERINVETDIKRKELEEKLANQN